MNDCRSSLTPSGSTLWQPTHRCPSDLKPTFQIFSAAELAGQAAAQRLTPEEQEVEDCCGHTEGNKGATAAATAATPAAATPPAAADDGNASGSAGAAEERPSEETAVTSLVSEMSVVSDDAMDEDVVELLGAPPPTGGISNSSTSNSTNETLQERGAHELRQGPGLAAMDVPANADEPPPAPQADASTASATPPADTDRSRSPTPRPPSSPPSPSAPLSAPAAPAAPPSRSPSPLDELLAMGFPRDAAVEALAASGGSIPDAAYKLLNPGMMASNGFGEGDAAATAVAAEGGAGAGRNQAAGGGGEDEGEVRLPRDVRLQHAADRIGGHGDRTRAAQVMFSLGARQPCAVYRGNDLCSTLGSCRGDYPA